jgi:hypothetical protein
MSLKQSILSNLKNIRGWRTNRKLVVFAVDDYGNVRLDSKQARDRMNQQGLKMHSRFDAYDALETAEDLAELYSALESVKDKNGRSAVFTAFTLPCNINFELMEAEGFKCYRYELLPDTFSKQPNGRTTWSLWKEGLQKRLIVAQFHGREHLNVRILEEKLKQQDHEVLTSLRNKSFCSITNSGYSTISYSAAFEFWDVKENESFHAILADGLRAFENVFEYKAKNFTPPGGTRHPSLWPTLYAQGVRYIDLPMLEKQHMGLGAYRNVWNYTGKVQDNNECVLMRNAVFEPTGNDSIDWTAQTLKQLEVSFRWGKPAIISSHRVNFSGHITESNRAKGIGSLRHLLNAIVNRWPDVEFISSDELGKIIFEGDQHV